MSDASLPGAPTLVGRRVAALLAALACSTLATAAAAQCLDDPGFEVGSQTLSVTLVNSSADGEVFGVRCTPSSAFVDPGQKQSGTGRAEFVADYSGYSLRTSVTAGGQATGNAAASALGSMRWVVVVESLPGYAGPSTVDVDVTAFVDISGSISVSGPGSAGGTYTNEYAIRPADQQFNFVSLIAGTGALATASPQTIQVTTSVDVDREYVLQISHSQTVTATVGTAMGVFGSSGSIGISRHSFGVEITPVFLDPLLSVYFPLEVVPGAEPPTPGGAPGFPPVIPALPPAALVLLAVALVVASWIARARAASSS